MMVTHRLDERNQELGVKVKNNTTWTVDGLIRPNDSWTMTYLLSASRNNTNDSIGLAGHFFAGWSPQNWYWGWATKLTDRKYVPGVGLVFANNTKHHNPGGYYIAEVRVVDDEGNEVGKDGATMGEIIIRGDAVMRGYYHDPAATAKAIRDGWFHSGDAAVVHSDGYIKIRDRWKDIIISGGENISSVEVEGVLLRHPAVQESAVVGMPHEKWGESPQAFIVLKSGCTATAEEMRLFCREHLAHFKVPHGFEFITELPKTATGKIQKYVLRGGRANITRQ